MVFMLRSPACWTCGLALVVLACGFAIVDLACGLACGLWLVSLLFDLEEIVFFKKHYNLPLHCTLDYHHLHHE